MTFIDLDELLTVLDPDQHGGRLPIDTVADAIRQLTTHIDTADLPRLIIDTIQRGEQEQRWTVSATTVLRGSTVLPKSIVMPRANLGDSPRPVNVPLRPELARWATSLPLSATQRELLIAVNEWLKHTNGGNVPIAAAAERAYQLIRDEKAFDSSPPRGGATLWQPDRLTFEMLRCERIATPLTWEPATPIIGNPGPMLCVENHATFRTLLRVLRDLPSPPWSAVAWVQGRNTAPLKSLKDLPFTITRLDYLGDLDTAGLEIAAAACAAAGSVGVPTGPAAELWGLLLQCPTRPGKRSDNSRTQQAVAWLPETIRDRALMLITAGETIPQEALRYDVLTAFIGGRHA